MLRTRHQKVVFVVTALVVVGWFMPEHSWLSPISNLVWLWGDK